MHIQFKHEFHVPPRGREICIWISFRDSGKRNTGKSFLAYGICILVHILIFACFSHMHSFTIKLIAINILQNVGFSWPRFLNRKRKKLLKITKWWTMVHYNDFPPAFQIVRTDYVNLMYLRNIITPIDKLQQLPTMLRIMPRSLSHCVH